MSDGLLRAWLDRQYALFLILAISSAALMSGCKISINNNSTDGDMPTPPPVTVSNNTPTAHDIWTLANADEASEIELDGRDTDTGDILTYEITTQPTHGTLSGTPPHIIYTPHPKYQGGDSFAYRVNDGRVNSAPATVSIALQAYCSSWRRMASPFAGGTGTQLDPYQICTDAQFLRIGQNMSAHFVLRSDISFTVPQPHGIGETWICLADAGWGAPGWSNPVTPFTGSLDGNYYSVLNYHIDATIAADPICGRLTTTKMFPRLVGATMRNVVFSNYSFSLASTSGAFIGEISGGSLLHRVGLVMASSSSSEGGIPFAEYVQGNSTLDEIYAQVNYMNVYGGGALIGYLANSTLKNSYVYGNYRFNDEYGLNPTGGLIQSVGNGATVENCYSRVNLVDVYNSGTFAGLFANVATPLSISGVFWDNELNLAPTGTYNGTEHGTGLTTMQAQTRSTFVGANWDENIWLLVDGSYPSLKWQQ